MGNGVLPHGPSYRAHPRLLAVTADIPDRQIGAMTACLLGRDVDTMRTKAGIERAVVDFSRKYGVLEPAPKRPPPLRIVKQRPRIDGGTAPVSRALSAYWASSTRRRRWPEQRTAMSLLAHQRGRTAAARCRQYGRGGLARSAPRNAAMAARFGSLVSCVACDRGARSCGPVVWPAVTSATARMRRCL
jgi:hypothetical protein